MPRSAQFRLCHLTCKGDLIYSPPHDVIECLLLAAQTQRLCRGRVQVIPDYAGLKAEVARHQAGEPYEQVMRRPTVRTKFTEAGSFRNEDTPPALAATTEGTFLQRIVRCWCYLANRISRSLLARMSRSPWSRSAATRCGSASPHPATSPSIDLKSAS